MLHSNWHVLLVRQNCQKFRSEQVARPRDVIVLLAAEVTHMALLFVYSDSTASHDLLLQRRKPRGPNLGKLGEFLRVVHYGQPWAVGK